MALAYLLDPVNQYQNRAGVNNVSGFFKVFRADTDDIATTYKDFNGTFNPERIPIDNNGRAIIIAESGRPYRVEMYLPNGSLEFTQYPVYPLAGGGSGLVAVNIESTDGSIDVDKTAIGGVTNFDLSMAADDSQFLDWIKCVGATAAGEGVLIPQKSEGTMHMSTSGIILRAGQLYHITARFSATKTSTEPFYDNVTLAFRTYDGETDSVVHQENRIIDYSLGLVQEFEVSADIKVGDANTSLRFAYGAQDVHGGEIRLVSADVHRIFSGISRAAGSLVQEQADWTEANPAAPSYIKNKPQNLVQDAAYVHTDNNFTTAEKDKLSGIETGAEVNVQANWTEANTSSDAYIQNKPQNLVQDAAYVHTDNNFTSAYKDKLDGIAAGAEVNVQANWAESNTSSDAYIQNKPSLATVATSGSYNDLSNKPTIPAAQVNSDWNASSGVAQILNKPNLATVATSGSYNDLSNKPTIPAAQVNSDWNASSGVSAILNKPNLATVATSGSYNDLSNKPSIPDAQVNSDWNAASGVAQILNKPSLAAVATSGAYSDLSGTPSIPAAANNGVLTITQNGTSKGTFSANQSGNNTIALTDTTYSQISRGSGAGLAPGLPSGSGTSKYLREDGTWQTPEVSSVDINEGSPASGTFIELRPGGGYVLSVGSKDIGFDTWAGKPSHAAELYVHHTWGTGNIPVYHVRNIMNGYINYVPVENVSGSCTVTIEAPHLSMDNEQYDYVVAFTSYTNSTLAGTVDVENCQPSGHYESGVFVADYPSLHGSNPVSSPVIFVTGPMYTYVEVRRT